MREPGSKRRGVLFGAVLLISMAAVTWWSAREHPRVRLEIVGQGLQAGKPVVVFRVGSTDGRQMRLDTIFIAMGPGSGSSAWRLPQFTAGSPEGSFAGQREFGVFAPVDWPVWRLRANAAIEAGVFTRSKVKWLVFRRYRNTPGMPSNLVSTSNFLMDTNFVDYTTNQVLESEPITNAIAQQRSSESPKGKQIER